LVAHGLVRSGVAVLARHGMDGRGKDWKGKAVLARRGMDGQGKAG
jgi:hypothetical protein